MINSTQQQQQAPPPQQPPAQPQGPPKMERKTIRILDPNQGGRDITEEIMSGGSSTATPTPSQFRILDPNQGGRDITEEIMPGGSSTTTPTPPQPPGPSQSQQGQRKEPREIISSMSLSDNMQLSNAEKDWKPMAKVSTQSHDAEDDEDDNPEQVKNQELFNHLDSILDKLTPQKFQELMKQVMDLRIDTEERLKGVIDLIFEKAISEPNSSVVYANMCRCLAGLKVPTAVKPGVSVNFRKLLLNCCKTEFEKDQDDIFEKKQKEIEAANDGEERERLRVELQESRDKARRRSLGNIKFTGELFKLKMLKGGIMHDCVVKLLKNHDEESLECLCMLLTTIGKDLDFEKDKPRMDQYFNQMGKIIRERKTSSRIRLILQDVLDLRKSNWVPRRGDQDPEGGGQTSQPQDEGWNTVPISKNRPIDTTCLNKITNWRIRDHNQGGRHITEELVPGGRSTTTPTPPRPPGSGRFQHCQRKVPRKIRSSSDDMQLHKVEEPWKPKKRMSTRSRGAERPEDNSLEQDKTIELFFRLRYILDKLTPQTFQKLMKQVMDLTIDTEQRLKVAIDLIFEKAISEPNSSVVYANMCRCLMGLKVPKSDEPGVTLNFRKLLLNRCQTEFEGHQDEIFEKKQKEIEAAKEEEEQERLSVELQESRDKALHRSLGNIKFIGELFKLRMLTVVIMHDCVVKLLKNHDEESLECLCMLLSTIGKDLDFEKAKPRMDQYFNNMDKIIKEKKTSSRISLLLQDILDLRRNKWVPRKGDKGPNTVDQIHKGAERPQVAVDEEINKIVTEQKVESTTGEEMESKEVDEKKVLTGEELSKQLDRLIQDKANNQRITDWAEANLDEQQSASNQFVRALMTSVCQSAIICDNPYRVDARQISQRASLLRRYLSDEQKELQALYALQALIVHMEQPRNLLRMFFDVLYDEDVIKEEAFYKWEASKDPVEQTGKGMALKSVTAFFIWLREAEDESDEE